MSSITKTKIVIRDAATTETLNACLERLTKDKIEKLEERVKELEKERDQLEIERDRSRGAGLAHADKLVQLEDAYGTDKFEQVWKIVMRW